MTQTQMKMASLYERLSKLGFSKSFLKERALPDWWDSEVEATPGSEVEAAAYISRRLNLDLLSLLQSEKTPIFKQSCQAKFKTKQGTETHRLYIAQCMAARVGEMVSLCCTQEIKTLPKKAQAVRREILQAQNRVNLEGLLNWCWRYGLPVVHFDGFPQAEGVQNFQGMATYFYNRPVIIISLKNHSLAQLLFLLAHELGHIIKGHVNEIGLVDEDVFLDNLDTEEIEASDFAVELLLCKPNPMYYNFPKLASQQLANYASEISERDLVDPGLVILNYAWFQSKLAKTEEEKSLLFCTTNQALKLIEKSADAPQLINGYLRQKLDLERLDEDSQAYLELAIGG